MRISDWSSDVCSSDLEDDPNSQLALENLVDFYVARNRPDAAGPLADYALRSFRRTTGAGSARSQRMERIVAAMPKPAPAVPPPSPPETVRQEDDVEKILPPAMESTGENRP